MKRVRVGPDDPRRQKIVALVGEAAFAKTLREGEPWGERQTWRAIAERHLLRIPARDISATPTVA